jgi:hypothetical protein
MVDVKNALAAASPVGRARLQDVVCNLPDIREVALLVPAEAGRFRWGKLLSQLKFALRWAVVVTARTPLSYAYRAVYRGHVWYAVRVAKRFPGTRAVYITRSMATGDITIGVSDIDMAIVGDWPEDEQIRLMRALGTLSAISPLYDSGLWQQVHGVEALRNLWETDYFFQSRFDEGRMQWKLAYGDDIVRSLPPVPRERVGGGYYMEARNWWLHFIASHFGSGPTARDTIFRNSIAYKAVTEISGIERALRTGTAPASRQASLRLAIEESSAEERGFLERLGRIARSGYVRSCGDIREKSTAFLLPLLDRIHGRLEGLPSFEAVGEFQVDARADEVARTPYAIAHARRLVEHVKARWPGYRAASLAPTAACFALDNLVLSIEVNPARLPSFGQLQELCKLHVSACCAFRQLISLYLLLPSGACQLDVANLAEMWRVMLFPPSAPDLFALLERPEYRIDGEAAGIGSQPVWSRFARDLAIEELNVRRSVLSRITPQVFPSSLEIIRNVYRQLQLEYLVWTSARGPAKFALSPVAIERGLESMGLSDEAITGALRDAYIRELRGETTDVRPSVPKILEFLRRFTWELP